MPEVVLAVARFGFLILLWIFVFAVIGVIRRDVFFAARRSKLVAAPPTLSASQARQPFAKPKPGRPAHRLVVTEGAHAGTEITLGSAPLTFGRAEDSTLVLTDEYASAMHARLTPQGGQWLLEDLGSTNGTFLNRAKVLAPTPVPVGVEIRIGHTAFELRP